MTKYTMGGFDTTHLPSILTVNFVRVGITMPHVATTGGFEEFVKRVLIEV